MEPSAGLSEALVTRLFTTAGESPFKKIVWEVRDAWPEGSPYHVRGLTVPSFWSQNALDITSKLYLSKSETTPERGVDELVKRVAAKITVEGINGGYFGARVNFSDPDTPSTNRARVTYCESLTMHDEAKVFYDELCHILLHQLAVFNSPVLFNVGRDDREQQVSACQPYHSLVSTPSGPMPIGRIVEIREQYPLQDMSVCSAFGDAEVLAVKRNGVKEVLRVTTKSGQQLDVTADHLVWSATRREHVRAGELTTDEMVEWHRISEMDVTPVHRDHDLWISEAALAGWLQTDGFVGKYEGTNKSMIIEALSVTEPERLWVQEHVDVVFPDVHRHHSTEVTLDKTIDFRRVRLYGAQLENFVEQYGLMERREGKRVPWQIMGGHREVVVAYLRSVFQADGYIASGKIKLHTISHDFALGLKTLLSRLGIFSRVKGVQDKRENRKPGWVLMIGPLPDRRRFAVDVGFIDDRKQDKLRASLDQKGIAEKIVKRQMIESIQSIGEMEVFDIQTSTGEYLADGLRVHNCFILSVEDTTESIKGTSAREIDIFRGGSGSGYDVSRMRGSMEKLSGGGTSSGPVSFMRLWDAGAGTFKSGGKTRRAAKLVKMDLDHPDIRDFILCKPREEERIKILQDAGVNLGFDEEGERNLAEVTSFQNENISVGATDEFMRKALYAADPDATNWPLYARARHNVGQIISMDDAAELLDLVAEAAWKCACPGMFYMDAIQSMHTTPSIAGKLSPIRSSNPCFPGETLVDTSEGRIRIDRLAEMHATGQVLPYAFGFDRTSALPAMKRIRQAIMTKMVTELVEVTTDKGVIFRCTPDHKVLTRDGERSSTGGYVEAEDLVPGQRLRKVGRAVNEHRSDRRYLNHRATEDAPSGTSTQAPWMWEQAYGPIPSGMEVHHLNEDPTDDRLSNFELIDSGTHQSFHSTGARNGRYIEAAEHVLVETFEAIENLIGQATPSRWNHYVEETGLKGSIPLANTGTRRIRGMSWEDFVLWIEDRKSLVNDTVKSVVRVDLGQAIPVYDISVEDVHNFGVATEGVEHTIVVSNCGEFLHNDDTSCNLGSVNVDKFVGDDGSFDVEGFQHVVDVMALAMEICVELGHFPDERLTYMSKSLRPLGLGYSNMGAAIMSQGLPYDSDEGRDFAGSVTALLTGRVYRKSAHVAGRLGSFRFFEENREAMLGVISKHMDALPTVGPDATVQSNPIWQAAAVDWDDALRDGTEYGFRNSQATVIPPAGTTSYFLDCDTTGIEPAFLHAIHKELAGGGSMMILNKSLRRAANALGGYSRSDLERVAAGDLSCVSDEDRAVFHTAGEISPEGHLRMMAAVQPFVSGAISKTINMANSATVQDVKDAYVLAWRLGLKDVAIYRDGSKARQPHKAKSEVEAKRGGVQVVINQSSTPFDAAALARDVAFAFRSGGPQAAAPDTPQRQISPPPREALPRTRNAVAHKITIRGAFGDYKGYVHAGTYPDGRLAELFVSGFGRAGGFTLNALGAWATDFSIAIQHGIDPWPLLRNHYRVKDETGGVVVPDPGERVVIRSAESIIDYVVRWIALEFGDREIREEFNVLTPEEKMGGEREERLAEQVDPEPDDTTPVSGLSAPAFVNGSNGHQSPDVIGASFSHKAIGGFVGPVCSECGSTMRPTGGCYTCNCGNTTGCG